MMGGGAVVIFILYSIFDATIFVWLVAKDVGTDGSFLFFLDNLAVSAQGFRRGANRVRKVRLCTVF